MRQDTPGSTPESEPQPDPQSPPLPEEPQDPPAPESDEEVDEGEESQSSLPSFKRKPQMAVVLAPSRLPGEPVAELSRLPHPTSSYRALSADEFAYINDRAVVFKKTYAELNNPGQNKVFWDFYSPNAENNKTRRKTSASIEFVYRSLSRRACDREASYRLEMRIYDHKHPNGRTLPHKNSRNHLEQLVAYGGITVPDEGVWRWVEKRDGQQVGETTFEVKRLVNAPSSWTRRINGNLQTILLPFVAHTSDDWTVRSIDYTFPSFNDGPTGEASRFRAEWNWFSPTGKGKPYIKIKTDYLSDGAQYRLLVRAYDGLYPKGRIIRFQEGEGWLPEATITYGVGLPTAGTWKFQEKIDGVETECVSLQVRQLYLGVQSPNLIYLDNPSQVYRLHLMSGPTGYTVKNFKWTLDRRDSATQVLLRKYEGEVVDNAQNALSWEQIWDGKDESGATVTLGTAVSAQFSIEVPNDPDEIVNSFNDFMNKCRREIRNVPQRQLAPSRVHCDCQGGGHNHHHASPQGESGQGQGPGGGGGGSSTRFYLLTGPNPMKGPAHRGGMWVYVPESEATLRVLGAGTPIFQSATAPVDTRVEELPIRIDTPGGLPPKYLRVEFRDPAGNYPCGDWGDMYLRASDGSVNQKVVPNRTEFAQYFGIPPIPVTACIAMLFATLPDFQLPPPQAVAAAPAAAPAPVVASSGLYALHNYMNTGGPVSVGLDVSSGLYNHVEVDLTVPTGGLTASVARYWHSGGDGLSLGTLVPGISNQLRAQYGWVWSFQRELNFFNQGTICHVIRPDGGRDEFKLVSGQWQPARADIVDRLTQVDSIHFEIETKSHDFYRYRLPNGVSHRDFYSRAFLAEERDMHNNRLLYDWDTTGSRLNRIRNGSTNQPLLDFEWGIGQAGSPDSWLQLNAVRDRVGNRAVTYSYRSAPYPYHNQGMLSQVAQPGAVTLQYDYNVASLQRAAGVGQISVPGALVGTPQRRTYYQLLADYELQFSLREIRRNNQVQAIFSATNAQGSILRETNRQNLMTYRRENSSPIPGAQIRVLRIPQANPGDTRRTDYSFNALGRPTSIWDTQGRRRQFEYDPASNLRRYVDSLNQESTFSFDARRNLLQARDPEGRTYNFVYDNRDRLTEVRSPLPGAVARFAYNSFDDLISTTDPDQATTTFTYTQAGRIATMRDALSRIWSYAYDQNGFLAEVREPAVNGVVARWGFQNDNLGRVTAELSQGTVLKETTYDARDRVASTSLLESNFASRLPTRRTTTFAYNAFDQITSVTDPLGRVTRLFYDQYQRPERTQRPDGTSVGRSYNAQGEVASHYNGAGARTFYFYDPMHRITEIRHPGDPNAERFQYDNKGRLSAWVRASGTVSYIYDRLDRIDQIRFNGQTQIDYNYDILGRLEQMSDTIGVTRYQYSPGSDLLRVTDSFNRSIDYQYDLANQLLRRTDPQGLATTFAYNERGQVRSASHDGLTSNYEYNALGAPTRVTWQNGLTETYQYSSQGEAMERSVSFPGPGIGIHRPARWTGTQAGGRLHHSWRYAPAHLCLRLDGSPDRLDPTTSTQRWSSDFGHLPI